MSQQVSTDHIAHLETRLSNHYHTLNNQLNQYAICRVPASMVKLPPVAIFISIFSAGSLALIYSLGLEWWFKGFGLIIPIFLAWSHLYEIQPQQQQQQQQQQQSEPTTLPQQQQPQPPNQQSPLQEISQPNDPAYLFWSKYFLIYSLSIIVDKFFRSFISISSDEWMSSYTFFFNVHMFFIVLPPWYYPQLLYSFLLEPVLLIHYETIISSYETTRSTFGTIAQDTLTTTTTAFKSVSKHALVGGISSLTQNSSAR
jgi:hypothetical protein